MWKSTGVKPEQLAEHPQPPEELAYLWEWYLELKGENSLTYTEIKNWADITHQSPLAWEVDTLKTLDRIYWRVIHG